MLKKVITIVALQLVTFGVLFLEILSWGENSEINKTVDLVTYSASAVILFLFTKSLIQFKNENVQNIFFKITVLGLLCLPALYFFCLPWFNAVLSLKSI